MSELAITEEPMISPRRIAERRKVGMPKVIDVIRDLETRGEISPQRTATSRLLLSFTDATCVDLVLGG